MPQNPEYEKITILSETSERVVRTVIQRSFNNEWEVKWYDNQIADDIRYYNLPPDIEFIQLTVHPLKEENGRFFDQVTFDLTHPDWVDAGSRNLALANFLAVNGFFDYPEEKLDVIRQTFLAGWDAKKERQIIDSSQG